MRIRLLLISFVFLASSAMAKEKPVGHAILPCQRVFVTGHQIKAVQWADKHLFETTCMVPVANPSSATAVLVLEPAPGITPGYGAVPNEESETYWVDCYSSVDSVTCNDSDGRQETTTCYEDKWGGVVCKSYSGDLLGDIAALLKNAMLKNEAYAYLYATKTHALLWKYEYTDSKSFLTAGWRDELAYAGSCQGKFKSDPWHAAPRALDWRCERKKLPVDLLPETSRK